MTFVVELIEFTLIEGIDNTSFLKATRRAESKFFIKQTGFLSSDLLKEGSTWVYIRCWKNKEEAKRAQEVFPYDSSSLPFIQIIAPKSVKVVYLACMKSYCKSFFVKERFPR